MPGKGAGGMSSASTLAKGRVVDAVRDDAAARETDLVRRASCFCRGDKFKSNPKSDASHIDPFPAPRPIEDDADDGGKCDMRRNTAYVALGLGREMVVW